MILTSRRLIFIHSYSGWIFLFEYQLYQMCDQSDFIITIRRVWHSVRCICCDQGCEEPARERHQNHRIQWTHATRHGGYSPG